MRILIAGGTGFIGSALSALLIGEGNDIVALSRKPGPNRFVWHPATGEIDADAMEGFDIVVQLTGESVARRWTVDKKRRIWESRVDATALIARTLAKLNQKPRAFLSASGIGYYGNGGDAVLTEDGAKGVGFLADLTEAWEQATDPATEAGIRVVKMRISPVFASDGGTLPKMLKPYRWFVGGRLGSGRQYMSWIHLTDMMRAIKFLISHEDLDGPINITAPNPVTNAALTRVIAKILHRSAVLPIPVFALRLLFGEFADEALLASQRAVPQRLVDAGFQFRYPDVESALRQAL